MGKENEDILPEIIKSWKWKVCYGAMWASENPKKAFEFAWIRENVFLVCEFLRAWSRELPRPRGASLMIFVRKVFLHNALIQQSYFNGRIIYDFVDFLVLGKTLESK